MMEQKYAASVEQVFALLSDPRWIEQRCLALGELAAKVKSRKSAGAVVLTMTRRVRRDLPALLARVVSPESDLQFEETWSAPQEGIRRGHLRITAPGQPLTVTADFELAPAGKGSVYRIKHVTKADVPLIHAAVERWVQGQIEEGCAAEFAYTSKAVKVAGGRPQG